MIKRTLLSAVGLIGVASPISTQGPPHECVEVPSYAETWSDPDTWGGTVPDGTTPILVDKTIYLDVDPPTLIDLTITGELIFICESRTLDAKRILIKDGGSLSVGTAATPFEHSAKIRVRGSCTGDPADWGIFVESGGELQLHGMPRSHSWVRLASTAEAGQPDLLLDAAVDWSVGDTIVVASSDFDMLHAEELTIAARSGSLITVSANLTREHFADDVGSGQNTVPEYAEVGLLTRNVVVEGNTTCQGTPTDRGHVMLSNPTGGIPRAELSWVEFRELGNEGELGRYPIHFHQIGDASASSVKNCSISRSYNKAIVAHDVQALLLSGNVAYDTIGHAFYMEETNPGDVTGCTWQNNLGLVVRAAPDDSIAPFDDRPGVFYTSNPDNTIINNAAAGSDGYGFVLRMLGNPSAGPNLSYQGNIAHSAQLIGFFQNDRPLQTPDLTVDPPFFKDIVAYKNRYFGIWVRGHGTLVLEDLKAADNTGGVYGRLVRSCHGHSRPHGADPQDLDHHRREHREHRLRLSVGVDGA